VRPSMAFVPILAASLLLALLTGFGATAQQPATPADPAEKEEASTPATAPPDAQTQLPPDDYQASEQISEDLSVSFPVDI